MHAPETLSSNARVPPCETAVVHAMMRYVYDLYYINGTMCNKQVSLSQFEALIRNEAAGLSVRRHAASLLRVALEQEQAGRKNPPPPAPPSTAAHATTVEILPYYCCTSTLPVAGTAVQQ